MATTEILQFCPTDTGSNLLSQAAYLAASGRVTGHAPGIASLELENKALRQSSLIAAGVAQYMADKQGTNVTDLLTPAQISLMLGQAFGGQLINVRQILTTAVYTPTAGTKAVLVMLQAAGGAGGGTTATGAGQVAAGLGGGGGAYAMSYYTTGFSGVTVTLGAIGTGTNGGAGNAAGSASFGALMSCPGGNGGQVSGPQAPPSLSGGGASSANPSGGNLFMSSGGAALPAFYIGTGAFFSGTGGASFFGQGGILVGTATVGGNVGRGYGSGGSGGSAVQSNPGTTGGGSGAPGLCLIFEFGG